MPKELKIAAVDFYGNVVELVVNELEWLYHVKHPQLTLTKYEEALRKRYLYGKRVKMKRIGKAAFVLVLLYCTLGSVFRLYAQATAGYTKVNATPIAGTSFTSGTLTNGVAYNVEVTALNSAGIESGPSNILTGIVPATGTHTFTITWTPGTGDVTYNVYDQVVASANPPVAGSLTIN